MHFSDFYVVLLGFKCVLPLEPACRLRAQFPTIGGDFFFFGFATAFNIGFVMPTVASHCLLLLSLPSIVVVVYYCRTIAMLLL